MVSFSSNLIALCFSSGGSFFTATGLILMKLANMKIEKFKHKKIVLQPEWLLGLFLMGVGLTCNGCKLTSLVFLTFLFYF